MTTHVVQQGECLSRIAHQYGFPDYKTIYDHPSNSGFKQKRPNPNIIYEGDELQIPDLRERIVECATDKVHEFKAKRPKRLLQIVVRDWEDQALANEDYELIVEEESIKGQTDGDGLLKQEIRMDAEEASVTIDGQTWPIGIAHLNPMDDTDDDGLSGIQARLKNLGYDPGPVDGVTGPRTRAAIRHFQRDNDLDVDGICGPKTKSKLKDIYGC